MNDTRVPRHKGHPAHTTRVPLLADQADRLYRLRLRLAEAQAAEAALTRELLDGLRAHGLTRLAGVAAIATVEPETSMVPLARLTQRERRRIGEADVPAADLEAYAVPIAQPVLRLSPAPTSKGVAA